MKLSAEISTLIHETIDKGEIVHPVSLAQQIIESHGHINGPGANWFKMCAYQYVRDMVREAIRRSKMPDEEDSQMTLPGWVHLQRAYAVRRDGEDVGVPVWRLTEQEIEAKIADLVRMSRGCIAHAEELKRYLKTERTQ